MPHQGCTASSCCPPFCRCCPGLFPIPAESSFGTFPQSCEWAEFSPGPPVNVLASSHLWQEPSCLAPGLCCCHPPPWLEPPCLPGYSPQRLAHSCLAVVLRNLLQGLRSERAVQDSYTMHRTAWKLDARIRLEAWMRNIQKSRGKMLLMERMMSTEALRATAGRKSKLGETMTRW